MSVLVGVEHDNALVKDATLAAVTAAGKLGDVVALVADRGAHGAAHFAAKFVSLSKVLLADDATYDHTPAENVAR